MEEKEIDLKILFKYVLSKWYMVIIITILLFAGGYSLGMFENEVVPPSVTTQAKVLFVRESTNSGNKYYSFTDKDGLVSSLSTSTDNNGLSADYGAILSSKDTAVEALGDYDLDFIKNITCTSNGDTILVTYNGEDIEAERLNSLISVTNKKIEEIFGDKAWIIEAPNSIIHHVDNSLRYASIGALIGFAGTVVLFVMIYMLSDKIRSVKDLKDEYGANVLEVVNYDNRI